MFIISGKYDAFQDAILRTKIERNGNGVGRKAIQVVFDLVIDEVNRNLVPGDILKKQNATDQEYKDFSAVLNFLSRNIGGSLDGAFDMYYIECSSMHGHKVEKVRYLVPDNVITIAHDTKQKMSLQVILGEAKSCDAADVLPKEMFKMVKGLLKGLIYSDETFGYLTTANNNYLV